MPIEDIALLGFLGIIVVTVIDWRRGKTAIGRLRLTKEGNPEKYWMALVIYFNMAFALFWLAGRAAQSDSDSDQSGEERTITIEVASA